MNSESDHGGVVCGIDEAGRGPVIGPMVMSIVCADRGVLEHLKVKDSKLLSRRQRESLFTKIMSVSTRVEYVIITAKELNVLMNAKTLNEIELEHAVRLIRYSVSDVVVDCFDVNESRASERMSKLTDRNVKCIHKADRDYSAVSAASIVSKVTRDNEIDKIVEKFGDVGSGYPADPRTREFMEISFRNGRDISDIARTHWKTYSDIRKQVRNKKLF